MPAVAGEELQPLGVDVLPLVEAEAASGPPAPVQEGGDSLSDDPPFLVPNTVVGKNRLRRLHRRQELTSTPPRRGWVGAPGQPNNPAVALAAEPRGE